MPLRGVTPIPAADTPHTPASREYQQSSAAAAPSEWASPAGRKQGWSKGRGWCERGWLRGGWRRRPAEGDGHVGGGADGGGLEGLKEEKAAVVGLVTSAAGGELGDVEWREERVEVLARLARSDAEEGGEDDGEEEAVEVDATR